MKRLACLFVAALAFAAADSVLAQPSSCTGRPSDVRLWVDVESVRSAEGVIAVTLYADDSSKFLAKRGSLYVGRVPAVMGTTSVCIHVPRMGTYALAVYHDEDADRKFDRTGIGLPDEPFGFSNNPRVFLGMPAWRSVRLAVPRTEMRTSIRLRHP